MAKIGDDVIRPMMRALDDAPIHLRSVKTAVIQLKAKQGRNRDGVGDVDKFDDKSGPVRQFDVGTYQDLKRRSQSGDGMQHDHTPSSAALIRAKENELGRRLTPSERRELTQNGVAVELLDSMHYASRTYGGKNTQDQISRDALDLKQAMENDLEVLSQNLREKMGIDQIEIDSILQRVRDLNRERGIG